MRTPTRLATTVAIATAALAGCGKPAGQAEQAASASSPPAVDATALQTQAAALFQPLPAEVASDKHPITEARVALGRMLYYETRLSKNQDISCNTCHDLARYGVDGEPTSGGHKGQRGGRNSPTVYNAALHIAQFWDGRAADVEEQAKGPVLNPIEMAMPDAGYVVKVLKSIPGYVDAFKAAFPDAADPVTYDNAAAAIGAFERRLVTPAPFDRFVAGDAAALTPAQLVGLKTFVDTGCATCHNGAAAGGAMYQKLGLVKPFETADAGRAEVTKNDADRFFFKVPSLRNITETGPYFHDGSVASLDDAIRLMAEHQLGRAVSEQQVGEIREFLASLKGEIPADYITPPAMPVSGPDTPKPDPT
jgi:cytochrome c peroxidase